MSDHDAMLARLTELRADLGDGERALNDLDAQRERLVTSMLRISGAVQVLEELTATAAAERSGGVNANGGGGQ